MIIVYKECERCKELSRLGVFGYDECTIQVEIPIEKLCVRCQIRKEKVLKEFMKGGER